ncbi:hypothetical protein GM182_07400 [bacterium 3DAC]|nr:hypothetical protein GM182_07400 [bacterium 3DAC]
MLETPVLHEEFKKALKTGAEIRNLYLKGFYVFVAYVVIALGTAYVAHISTNPLLNFIIAIVVLGAQGILLYSLFVFREALKDHRELIKEMEAYQHSFIHVSFMSDLGITANVILTILYGLSRMVTYAGRINSYIYDMIFLIALELSFIIFFSLMYLALFKSTKNVLFILAYIGFLPIFPTEAYIRHLVHIGKLSITNGTLVGLAIGLALWWLNLVFWKYAYITAYKTYKGEGTK